MPRFFMHIRTDTTSSEDPDGIELPDLETARAEANADLRHIVAEAIRRNLAPGNQRIEICDVAGLLLAAVSIQDAIGPLLP